MKHLDKDLIVDLFYNQKKSKQEIADILGVAKKTLLNFCSKNSISLTHHQKNPKDLSNLSFGRLVAKELVGKNKYGKDRWLCECECGNTKIVDKASLVRGLTTSCGCFKSEKCFKGYAKISLTYWNKVKKCAAERNIFFDITIEQAWDQFIKQNNKCALCGVELTLSKDYNVSRKNQTASLDRIDSDKGYTIDNIQWIHKDLNFMKRDFDQNYFIRLCVEVALHKGELPSDTERYKIYTKPQE